MKRAGLRGSFWPTPNQEALLRLTLGSSVKAEQRWRALQPIDVQALEPGSFGLLPLLCERLSEVAPADNRLPLLRGVCRSNWLRNQLLIERLAALIPAFRTRGIDPLVIGGVSIITRWYSGLASRPLPQIELAIDPGDGGNAADAVTASGWRCLSRDGVLCWFADDDGCKLVLNEGLPSLVAGPLGRAGALRELRGRATRRPVLDTDVIMLQPVDELMIACGLGARTTIPFTIQWLIDAAKALTASERPAPDELVARARRYRLVEPVRETVTYLAKGIGIDLDEYLSPLAAEPVTRRETLAYRMSGLSAGGFVGLPVVVASGLRTTSELPAGRALAGMPHQLQEAWGATSLHQTAAFGVRKLLRRARRERSTRLQSRQAISLSALGRKRSASS